MATKFLHSLAFMILVSTILLLPGCPGSDTGGEAGGTASNQRQQFIDLGTAPGAGAFFPVGTAIAEVLNEHKGDNKWRVQAKGSRGSLENIRRLEAKEFQLGMSNSAISWFALQGQGEWSTPQQIRSVVTLAPNVAMFLTKRDSGIKTIADFKGKRIVLGPEGAGFEMFVTLILKEHGVELTDITALNAEQGKAVELLADGAIDAAFLGGAVPTISVQQACSNMDILLIPFDEAARARLIEKYPFFQAATIPATLERDGKSEPTYRGMTEDFQGLDVGKMHLITHEQVDEDLVYRLTKTLWENRAAVVERHVVGKTINEKNAAKPNGVPFHPGAVRFYKEIGIWPESGS